MKKPIILLDCPTWFYVQGSDVLKHLYENERKLIISHKKFIFSQLKSYIEDIKIRSSFDTDAQLQCYGICKRVDGTFLKLSLNENTK